MQDMSEQYEELGSELLTEANEAHKDGDHEDAEIAEEMASEMFSLSQQVRDYQEENDVYYPCPAQ